MTTHTRYRCRGAGTSAHRVIRYPFGGTSIVPFDLYGRGRRYAAAYLREEIAQCGHRGMHDACMARYVDLVARR